jgi:hypothetical protein
MPELSSAGEKIGARKGYASDVTDRLQDGMTGVFCRVFRQSLSMAHKKGFA